MAEAYETKDFRDWMRGLHDTRARGRISARIDRLKLGNAGDVEPVGEGVSELRIHYAPGYRVYFKPVKDDFILLCGGTKRTQKRDITNAKSIARSLEE